MQQHGMQDAQASLRKRLRTWAQLRRAAADGHFSGGLYEAQLELVRGHARRWLGRDGVDELRVLDVGCGQRAPMTCLLDAAGARVTGIDVERPTGPLSTLALVRASLPYGMDRTMKSVGRRLLGYDRIFYRNIGRFVDGPIRPRDVDLRLMDVSHLEFPDDEFDLIYSALAFEHVADVAGAVRELWRVCRKPRALIVVRIHLFTSITGGHNQPQELAAAGGPLPPWAHLLDERYLPSIYLNRVRLDDYLRFFAACFELRDVHKKVDPEAVPLLTPEVAHSLPQYSREELLTELVTIVATPRDGVGVA
jgi:SAM-dependent methyltransferase